MTKSFSGSLPIRVKVEPPSFINYSLIHARGPTVGLKFTIFNDGDAALQAGKLEFVLRDFASRLRKLAQQPRGHHRT